MIVVQPLQEVLKVSKLHYMIVIVVASKDQGALTAKIRRAVIVIVTQPLQEVLKVGKLHFMIVTEL